MTVDEILQAEKIIDRKRRPPMKEDYRHKKMEIELQCSQYPSLRMSMFIRISQDFQEDFSVGLRLSGGAIAEYDMVLVRFQGPHGGQSASMSVDELHNAYHIHRMTENDLAVRRKRASYKGPGNFQSFDQAIVEFLAYCNINDVNGIFDPEKENSAQIRMNV